MAKLKGKYIEDNTITEDKLKFSNSPTTNYIVEYDGTNFNWVSKPVDTHDVKVSANDTTPGFLNGKLIGATNKITLTENNDAGNETLTINVGSDVFDKSSDTMDDISNGTTYVKTTNDYTDAEKSKLAGVEAGADVTDSTNVNAAGAVMNSDTSTASMNFVIDEDDMSSNSNTKVPTQQSVKAYADSLLAANDAMTYKGAIDCSGDPNYPAANAGDTYKISVAGKIGGASGTNVEAGDLAICLVDSTSAGDQATVGANWNIIQVNIDGAVIGPASSTNNHFVYFDGSTGKVIKDSGLTTGISDTNVVVINSSSVADNEYARFTANGLESRSTSEVLSDIGALSASSTATLTNKTFDANGTGNSISNIDVEDLASGTDGELITWDSSGNPTTVSVGTPGQVLTSNGTGAAPTFQTPSATVAFITEIVTLDATDISNKYNDDLTQVPVTASSVRLCPVGGIPQEYSADFTIITDGANVKRINWSSLGLDGILESGDKLIVTYTY